MATRPWVTPAEVRDYTEREKVKNRSDAKLAMDIARSEQYVIRYTKNRFDDPAKCPEIPAEVKTAVILIAEVYGSSAAEGKGEYKSETFDDYSYTVADTEAKLGNLDLAPLLDDYIAEQEPNHSSMTMKLRRL
jgi:hypothetical protein